MYINFTTPMRKLQKLLSQFSYCVRNSECGHEIKKCKRMTTTTDLQCKVSVYKTHTHILKFNGISLESRQLF